MPVINNVGQSDHTARKQEALEKILDIHTKIVRSIVFRPSSRYADRSYLFCDLNAGPGKYGDNYGSPLIFSKVAQKNKLNYIAVFSEINKKNSRELVTNLCCMNNGTAFDHSCDMLRGSNVAGCSISSGGVEIVCNEDNTVTLNSIADLYRRNHAKYPYGFIYIDPNNHQGRFHEIKLLFDNPIFKFLDILIHISGTTIKRVSRAHQSQCLLEMLSVINKKYWLVQKPDTAFHWTFLLGTNWSKYPEDKRFDLVFANSDEGQSYLNQINYTRDEIRQMEDNVIIPDIQGLSLPSHL